MLSMTTGKTLKDKHMTTNTKQTQEASSVVDTLELTAAGETRVAIGSGAAPTWAQRNEGEAND